MERSLFKMKYKALIRFSLKYDPKSRAARKALDLAAGKFLELGASSTKDGIQYLTEIWEDVLAFKAAANVILQELEEEKELDFSHVEIEIETSPQCRCGYVARIDDEHCSSCGEKLDLSSDLKEED